MCYILYENAENWNQDFKHLKYCDKFKLFLVTYKYVKYTARAAVNIWKERERDVRMLISFYMSLVSSI